MTEYEKEMMYAYKKAAMDYSSDITALYIELEHIADKYLKSGEISPGHSFPVPLGNRAVLTFSFYEESTRALVFQYEAEKLEVLFREDEFGPAAVEKEHITLDAISRLLKAMGTAIGAPVSKEFVMMLKTIKPGEILSFEEGSAYVCEKNDGLNLALKPVYRGNVSSLNISDFLDMPSVNIDLFDWTSCGRFYTENKKYLTESTELGVTKLSQAVEQVKNIESHMKKGANIVQIGPVKLCADKKLFGKVTWRDGDGKIIPRESVEYLAGYLNSHPKEVKLVRTNEETPSTLLSDEEFLLKIENYSKSGDFDKVCYEITSEVISEKSAVSVEVKGYQKDGEFSYKAKSFQFVEENGACKIFECYHKDNNVGSEIDGQKEVTPAYFASVYKGFYDGQKQIFFAEEFSKIVAEMNKNVRKIDDRAAKNVGEIAKNSADNKMGNEPPLVSRRTIAISDYKNILLGNSKATKNVANLVRRKDENDDLER